MTNHEQISPPDRSHSLQLDFDRRRRCGYPEAIYAEGKSVAVLLEIFKQFQQIPEDCLATRVSPEQAEAVSQSFPAVIYHPVARTLRLMSAEKQPIEKAKRILVVTAGTTDAGVAEEAAETLRWMGYQPVRIDDIGVAGPQRLLDRVDELQAADVIIVAAGMEGALPSVIGGWVRCPVVAVPTSVGYGANFGGITALLGMLNSCAANVCVVNIDAGFKAGFLAGLIADS